MKERREILSELGKCVSGKGKDSFDHRGGEQCSSALFKRQSETRRVGFRCSGVAAFGVCAPSTALVPSVAFVVTSVTYMCAFSSKEL